MAELPSFDPYHVLGVDKSADAVSIKKAYRKLALLKHPDKCLDESLRSARTDEFQQLNEAYDILGDDDKRKRHDALVKLDALRKEKASMSAHPRPFTRASTFHSGFPTTSNTTYTTRGPANVNVEDRAPRMSSDEDDFLKYPRRYTEYDHIRRPAAAPARERERTKSEKEASERRRDDRRRDNGIREARSAKYDYVNEKYESNVRAEDERRRREKESRTKEPMDPLTSKYADLEDGFYKYTGSTRSRPVMETRPSMGRRSSTRAVPPAQVRRSSALPKEGSRSYREYEDEEILSRERRAREDRDKLDREAKASRKERERRDRQYEPESPRSRAKENGRIPPLQHSNSSPPYANDEIRETLSRTKTEPPPKHTVPPIPRAQTMPTVSSNTATKRTAQPSKLRKSVAQDDDYSSSSESDRKPARPVQRHIYTRNSSSEENPVNIETRSPRRTASPEPTRPSSGALKFANILPKRPSAMHSRSTSHTIPLRTGRSPDRGSRRDRERERERDYSRDELLYGERMPPSPRRDSRDGVNYSKKIRDEDIIYSQRPATGRRERDREPYAGYSRPGLHRTYSIPVTATSQ